MEDERRHAYATRLQCWWRCILAVKIKHRKMLALKETPLEDVEEEAEKAALVLQVSLHVRVLCRRQLNNGHPLLKFVPQACASRGRGGRSKGRKTAMGALLVVLTRCTKPFARMIYGPIDQDHTYRLYLYTKYKSRHFAYKPPSVFAAETEELLQSLLGQGKNPISGHSGFHTPSLLCAVSLWSEHDQGRSWYMVHPPFTLLLFSVARPASPLSATGEQ